MYRYEIEFLSDVPLSLFKLDEAIDKATKKTGWINLKIREIEQVPIIGYAPDDPNHYYGGTIGFEDGKVVNYPEDFLLEQKD